MVKKGISNPELSVIVAVYAGARHLIKCLQSLIDQNNPPSMEILVPFDIQDMAVNALQNQFPECEFIPVGIQGVERRVGKGKMLPPNRHRSIALQKARGRIIVITEDQIRVPENWCRQIVKTHVRYTAGAIGGTLTNNSFSLLGWAIYFSDYMAFQPPVGIRETHQLTDVNVSYKREALETVGHIWKENFSEPEVHAEMGNSGIKLFLSEDLNAFYSRQKPKLRYCLGERFVWGRVFGSDRVQGIPFIKRLVFTAISPGLPFLLLLRKARSGLVMKKNLFWFVMSFPLIKLLAFTWAAGEGWGYFTGSRTGKKKSHGYGKMGSLRPSPAWIPGSNLIQYMADLAGMGQAFKIPVVPGKPVNCALAGTGGIGQVRAQALALCPDTRLLAATDINSESLQRLTGQYGIKNYSRYDEMIADPEIDAIILSTPPDTHEQMTIRALKAGKHVLVEKPMAPTPQECRNMIQTAKECNRQLFTGFNQRFFPSVMEVKRSILKGEIGNLEYLKVYAGHSGLSEFKSAWMYDKKIMGGGVLADIGVHVIDLARYFMGDVVELTGEASSGIWKLDRVEDNGFILMKNRQGVKTFLHASWSEWKGYGYHIEAYGDKGMLRTAYAPMSFKKICMDKPGGRPQKFWNPYPWIMFREKLKGWQTTTCLSFVDEFREMAKSIRFPESRGLNANGFDGLQSVEIAHAVYDHPMQKVVLTGDANHESI